MAADKGRNAIIQQQQCSVPLVGGDAVPAEQRPDQLRSSIRQIGRVEGPVLLGKENGHGERVLRLSDSIASFASADCGALPAPGRSSSRADSEASFTLERPPRGGVDGASLPPIPRTFMCPISSLVMTDPVSTVDGMHYDRASIEAFFRSGRQTSPVTGQQLPSLTLLPNTGLKGAIEAYLELRREAECQRRDWEAYMHEHAQRSQQKLGKKKQQVRELRAALEANERQVLALELSGKSSNGTKGDAPGYDSSSAPSLTQSSSDRSAASPPESPERQSSAAAVWKAGPAPRPDPSTFAKPPARQRSLLDFFR